MTWRDRYSPVGSYDGVPFIVISHSLPFGRKYVMQEVLGDSRAYPEDLTTVASEFTLDAMIVGPNYDLDRTLLMEACNRPGPGALVHPWLGNLTVLPGRCLLREVSRAGGLCRLNLNFALWVAPAKPGLVTPSGSEVGQRGNDADTGSVADFLRKWKLSDAPGFVRRAGGKLVDKVVDAIDAQLQKVLGDGVSVSDALDASAALHSGALGELTTDPEAFGLKLVSSLQTAGRLDSVRGAMGFVRTLAQWGNDDAPIITSTPDRQQESDNRDAFNAIVRRTGLAELGRLTTQLDIESREDALAERARLVATYDTELIRSGDAFDDGGFDDMRGVADAVIKYLDEVATRLPASRIVTPARRQPSLVAAMQYYDDPERELELVARNRIRHPLFIPAGVELELLERAGL